MRGCFCASSPAFPFFIVCSTCFVESGEKATSKAGVKISVHLELPKMRERALGVAMTRIIVLWGLFLGFLFMKLPLLCQNNWI